MGLPRDLVTLAETLRSRGDINLFAPVERSGLMDSALTGSLVEHLRNKRFSEPERTLQMCLQALSVQHQELASRSTDAELVATLPPGTLGIARTTDQVLLEMLRTPVEEVILLGYELTDHKMIRLLVEAATGGADLIVICDRTRGAADRILNLGLGRLRVYQDRERLEGLPYSSMHAKCLLVNGTDLLITSANFTFHGLHGNVEIGIRMSGPPAWEARTIFSHLVEEGIVEEVRPT